MPNRCILGVGERGRRNGGEMWPRMLRGVLSLTLWVVCLDSYYSTLE